MEIYIREINFSNKPSGRVLFVLHRALVDTDERPITGIVATVTTGAPQLVEVQSSSSLESPLADMMVEHPNHKDTQLVL